MDDGELYVALPNAAAMALREGQRAARGDAISNDLNVAANALARLIAVYAVDPESRAHVAVTSEVQGDAGLGIASLWVRRSHMACALGLIRRVGLRLRGVSPEQRAP
jgi:hypothetical protein